MVEAVTAAVDDLLDCEQCGQQAAQGNSSIERGNWRVGRQAKAAEAAQIIDVAEIDQANGNAEDDQTNDDLSGETRCSVQRFGKGGQIEVIVAARRHRRADENSIDEER